jgi:hypothetical protein
MALVWAESGRKCGEDLLSRAPREADMNSGQTSPRIGESEDRLSVAV